MRGARIFAVGRDDIARWASKALDDDVVVVRDDAEIDAQPPGVAWLCPPEAAAELRARRPNDPVIAMRPPVLPWARLAHDVRNPVGVILGALAELDEDEAMVALALRGARKIAHLAECWEALASEVEPRPRVRLDGVLREAFEAFRAFEPRHAERIDISALPRKTEPGLVTDPRRLRLGVVCLLRHAARVTSAPVGVRVEPGPEIVLAADESLGLPPLEELDHEGWRTRSPRLAMGHALLDPLVSAWRVEDDALGLTLVP